MAIPNLIALIGLRKVIIAETRDYFARLQISAKDRDEEMAENGELSESYN